MPAERLIFFLVWLALALGCGALLAVTWQRWWAKRVAAGDATAKPPGQTGGPHIQ